MRSLMLAVVVGLLVTAGDAVASTVRIVRWAA